MRDANARSARGDDLDIVVGLEAGADDYVVKPVEPRVLDARIRAVLRRMARAGSPAETYGELVIDRGSLVVRRSGREVSLTPTELRLLLVLSGSPRQVFSRDQLLDLDRVAEIAREHMSARTELSREPLERVAPRAG